MPKPGSKTASVRLFMSDMSRLMWEVPTIVMRLLMLKGQYSYLTFLRHEIDDFLLGYTIQQAGQQGTRRAPIRNEKSINTGRKVQQASSILSRSGKCPFAL